MTADPRRNSCLAGNRTDPNWSPGPMGRATDPAPVNVVDDPGGPAPSWVGTDVPGGEGILSPRASQ